jgi:hypothetical protein
MQAEVGSLVCAARRSHRATPCANVLRPAAPTSPFISLLELPGGVGGRGGGDAFQACREIGCFRPISDIHYPEFIASKQSLACVRIFSITGCSRIAAMIFS